MKKFLVLFFTAVFVTLIARFAFASSSRIVGAVGGGEPTAASAPEQLVCSSGISQFGGRESIVIPPHDVYTATLSGIVSGGMAHFVRDVGPYSVKISYEPNAVVFSNDEEGIELTITPSADIGSFLVQANFKEGDMPAVPMTCHLATGIN